MKRSIYKVFGIAAFAVAAMCAISCTEKEPEVKVEPEFPEMVTDNEVEPGANLVLVFTPNMDWTLSIPEESFKWFKILDGKFEEQSISGKASKLPKRVTITTASDKSFSLRSCQVNLTMGGQTKAIASYTIKAEAKVLEVYPATYSDNGFSFNDSGYIYDTKQVTADDTIELVWDNNENTFLFPINVKSNFEWTASWPEWARADVNAESRVGDVPILMYGVDSKLPYEQTEGVVVFKDGDEQMASFKLVIPGAKDRFKFNMGGYTSLKFDHASYFRAEAGTFSKEPLEGSIFGPEECRVEVLDSTENGYAKVKEPWLNVVVSPWDNVQGSAVLQTRNVTVSAPRYTENKVRGAMILLLPATAPASLTDIFEAGMMQVKPEYAQYAITATQLARPTEFFTFDYSITEREFAGLYFGRSAENLLPQKNFTFAAGATSWQYDMTYSRGMASSKAAVNLTEPYASVEIYDAAGNIISENISEHWLNYEQLGDVMYGQVVMIEDNLPTVEVPGEDGKPVKVKVEEIDGYVVFKNDLGEVLSIVHCFYIKEKLSDVDIYEEASAEVFKDPAAAAAAGFTAYRITAGPTYQQYIEMESPVYLITGTKDGQTFTVKTSTACSMYTCQEEPNYGPKMVTVDNQIFSDPVIAERLAEYERAKAEYEEGRANGTIIDPNRVKEPKYPDTSDDRSTMGLLKFGETSFISRTYPGYSEIRMKMPEPEEGAEPVSKYKEVILFQTSSATKFVFICNLDLRGAVQGE
jgi:hypothetical protein